MYGILDLEWIFWMNNPGLLGPVAWGQVENKASMLALNMRFYPNSVG